MPDLTILDAALRCAASGYRVLPIKPGEKRPPMLEWTRAATTDKATIQGWFAPGGPYDGHGLGIALGWQSTPYGERCVFAIDLDEHDPAISGVANWQALIDQYGLNVVTVCSITGGGGMHWLFACETEVRNGKIAPGVDVRGVGGQIVVAPTLHPSGNPYRWERAPWDTELAEAPDWLLELVVKDEPERQPIKLDGGTPAPDSGRRIDVERGPADILRDSWDWRAELEGTGWTYDGPVASGGEGWVRPGKHRREGISAVLHPDTGVLVVFSTDDSMATLRSVGSVNRDGGVTLTPFDFLAAVKHHGDKRAAASMIRRQDNERKARAAASQLVKPAKSSGPRIIDPDDPDFDTAEQNEDDDEDDDDLGLIDWNEAFGNHAPEKPLIDGLIFPGRWTAFVGPAKSGKSTLTLHIAHCLARGIHPWIKTTLLPDGPVGVLYLDAEMGLLDTVGRLMAIGLVPSDLDNLAYTDLPHKFDTWEKATWLQRATKKVQPSLVILDGINGFVTGAEKDDTPWRMLYEFAISPLKRAGIAVVTTDNSGKDDSMGARGSTVKTDKADAIYALKPDRDEYSNFTTTVVRRHSRTQSFAESVRLTVLGVGTGAIEYLLPGSVPVPSTMIVSRDDVLRVCRTLVGLGVPDAAGVDESLRELRLGGYTVRRSLIEAAVEHRRAGRDVDMEGEHLTTEPLTSQLGELDDHEPDPNNLF